MQSPTVISVNVGVPREHGVAGASDPMDRPWTSAIFKHPVQGEVRVGLTNLDGDGQADLSHHGGADKAVLAYSYDHYAPWCREWNAARVPSGAFGENLTVVGLAEDLVCIGDVWRIGNVQLQVSQPRQPCWKLARRWHIKDLALRVQRNGRTGWYFRVLKEGNLGPELPIELVFRPFHAWTVARANRIMHQRSEDLIAVAELAALEPLSASWKRALYRIADGFPLDSHERLSAPDPPTTA
jgi:MOSC domain-containing protein YiiM